MAIEKPVLKIAETSEAFKAAIKSKSVENMPNNPSEMGWKAGDIKKRFYLPIYDKDNSVLAEINRVISEINGAYTTALIKYIQTIETAADMSDENIRKYIDSEVLKKLDKIDAVEIIYGTDESKNQIGISYSSEAEAGAIARYNEANAEGEATFRVGTPLTDKDATPKSYVKDLIKDISFERSADGSDVFILTITTKEDEVITKNVDLHLESLVTKVDDYKGDDGKYYLQLTFQDGSTHEYPLDEVFRGINDLLADVRAEVTANSKAIETKLDKPEIYDQFNLYGEAVLSAIDLDGKPISLEASSYSPYSGSVVMRDAYGGIRIAQAPNDDSAIDKRMAKQYKNEAVNEAKAYTDEKVNDALNNGDVEFVSQLEQRVSALETTLLQKVDDNTVAAYKAVPANAYPRAMLNSFGGMTYRKVGDNLFNCPFEGIDIVMDTNSVGLVVGSVTLPAGTYSYQFSDADGITLLPGEYAPFEDIALVIDTDPWNYTALSNPFTLSAETTVSLLAVSMSHTDTITLKGFHVMLNNGSTQLPFVPFRQYLEDTKVTEIVSHGANLLDLSKAVNQNFVDNGDGTYTFTRTSADANGRFSAVFPLKIPAGVSIAFCGERSNDISVGFQFLTETLEPTSTTANLNGEVFLRTFTEAVAKARLYLPSSAAVGDSCTVAKVRMNIGSSILPYTPYREPIRYPIPEAIQAQMSGKGFLDIKNNTEYLDTVNFDSGKCEYNVSTIILNGTETWKSEIRNSATKNLNFYMDVRIGKPYTPVFCNYFESNVGRSTGMDNNMWISGTGKLNCTAVGFASVDEWKAHLDRLYASGNPVTATYVLPETTEESLAAEMSKIIDVTPGGYLEFVTDTNNAIPSSVSFVVTK